jgi:hypothetical protein
LLPDKLLLRRKRIVVRLRMDKKNPEKYSGNH